MYYLPQFYDKTIILHVIVDENGHLKKMKLFRLGHNALKCWIRMTPKAAFFPFPLSICGGFRKCVVL